MASWTNIRNRWRTAGVFSRIFVILSIVFPLFYVAAPLMPFRLNFTPSMSQGLYYTYDCRPQKGDIVEFQPSDKIWQFALDRKYISGNETGFLKIVVATNGDKVCWQKKGIYINGKFKGNVALLDSMGRDLGHKDECITVIKDNFLPMTQNNKSFDGRYFGLVSFDKIQNCARPFWVF